MHSKNLLPSTPARGSQLGNHRWVALEGEWRQLKVRVFRISTRLHASGARFTPLRFCHRTSVLVPVGERPRGGRDGADFSPRQASRAASRLTSTPTMDS